MTVATEVVVIPSAIPPKPAVALKVMGAAGKPIVLPVVVPILMAPVLTSMALNKFVKPPDEVVCEIPAIVLF